MKRELRISKIKALVLVVISVTLFIYQLIQISYYRLREKETDNTNLESSFYRTSIESKLELARHNHYFLYSDFKNNLKLYANALEASPVYLQAWISLIDLLIDNRLENQARELLIYVDKIAGLSINELWDISLLALKLNETNMAVRNIAIFSQAVPYYERDRAFYILEKLDNGMELFIKYADDKSIVNYFIYTISINSYDHAMNLWNFIDKNNVEINQESELDFVNYLMSQMNFDKAYLIWKELYPAEGKDKNHIWNGSFENEIIKKGFDWNVLEVKGVDVVIDDETHFSGKYSLMISFHGEDNINYGHISQVIPLKEGGDYYLEYAYRSSNISTRSGLYVELDCIDNSKTLIKTDMILGNNNWQKHKLHFYTNDDCSGIILTLRRDSINKLDSKIKGTIWLDDFNLMEAG